MSALDDVIRYHADNCQSGSECDLSALSRAELSALRAENAELKAEMEQFDEHHRRVHDAYKSAVDTVEAQARQLSEAIEALQDIVNCAQLTAGEFVISGALYDQTVLTLQSIEAPAPQAEQGRYHNADR